MKRRVVITGLGALTPEEFKKRTQAFSRRLEKVADIVHLEDDDSFFRWCQNEGFEPVAVEIAEQPKYLPSFQFPARPAIVVGHEGKGLTPDFMRRCGACSRGRRDC